MAVCCCKPEFCTWTYYFEFRPWEWNFYFRIVSAHFQNQDSDEAFFIIHYFIGDRDFDKNIN